MEHTTITFEPRVIMEEGEPFNLAGFKSKQNCELQSASLQHRKTIGLSLQPVQSVQRH